MTVETEERARKLVGVVCEVSNGWETKRRKANLDKTIDYLKQRLDAVREPLTKILLVVEEIERAQRSGLYSFMKPQFDEVMATHHITHGQVAELIAEKTGSFDLYFSRVCSHYRGINRYDKEGMYVVFRRIFVTRPEAKNDLIGVATPSEIYKIENPPKPKK